ncbi:uncharacterized protein LOC130196855 isoform X2 [Pseudoliparis swirei]|uniref:uncharacterized protein LOC130196855 isoform X2 n=1 Tax=Pseudoliparis swirei TaxID=2059687 RepID=UPI0024BD718C|nr:uncharacterized protein LOC130196855 isoform X2 [Pseudoliparis swirei]
MDHHLKLFSCLEDTVHVCASRYRNNVADQGKESAIPVQLDTVSGCKGKNNHRPDFHSSFSNKLLGHKVRKGISRKEKLFCKINSNMATEHMAKPTPVYESKRTAGYNYGLPLSSPPAPNKKQPGGQRISVCLRKRPLMHTECRRGEADVVTTPSGECVIVHESKEAVDLSQYTLQHRFYFDQVFGEESSNEEVYQRTAYPLVQHMLNGGKATCFAFGQTGAGKTHTMLGSPLRPGLYALAVLDIFAYLSTTPMHSPLLVYVSFFEIYCGQLYDLLDHRKRLFAREDGQKVVHIVGLRDIRVDSVRSLLEVISRGTEERTQGMSGVNPLSSRSHALLQIQLRDTNQQIAGRMWFVDLAGSERASDTKEPNRQSRMEGAEINQSLLALKECIRSLDQEQSHTPFRQSKLTQVLKDSFVGDSMTCMIANISPGHLATEHTLNTLRYADRVKELKGQIGLRGGRRNKTIHDSPKQNLSNSSSSSSSRGNIVGTRGKSPTKKPKLGQQREDFGFTTPTTRLTTGGSIICSIPKNSRWGEETNPSTRKGIGLEHITPVRGLGIGDTRKRTGGREGRIRKGYGVTDSEFNHREKENQKSTLKEGRKEERRWIEQERQVESSRDTSSEVERSHKRDVQKDDERNKERERHLRQYHQQLQQFMPSSASSSVHLFSPSTCLSFSSSIQTSLSSSVPPSSSSSLQNTSCSSVSDCIQHGLGENLDACRARVDVRADNNSNKLSFFPRGDICLRTETSPSYSKHKDEIGHGGSGGVSEKWTISREGGEAIFGQDRGTHEKKSHKETGEGDVRVRREEWRPAGMEGGKERGWATTSETEHVNRMTGAIPADVEPLVVYNCVSEDSRYAGGEETDTSDDPRDGVWSTEEREEVDGYGLLSNHSGIDSNSLFNHPPAESSHQRAPAERPLSPACEHATLTPNKLSDLTRKFKHTRYPSNIAPLPLKNAQREMPPSSYKEKQPGFAALVNRTHFSNSHWAILPLTTPITRSGCKIPAKSLNILSESPAYPMEHSHPEVRAKGSVLPHEVTADSLSYIIDPISISLLQGDRQTATAPFLQGEQKKTSLCPLEIERAGEIVVDEDVEFRLSFLELPKSKTACPLISDTMTAANYTEQIKGMMKPPIPEVILVSLRDQENNQKPQTTPAIEVLGYIPPTSPLKTSTCGSTETSIMHSISSSAQPSGNTSSPNSHNLMTYSGATHVPPEYSRYMLSKLAFSISTPQSDSVLGQLNTVPKQCHTGHSNHPTNTNISLQKNCQETASNYTITPITNLSTLEDLDPRQWCVVQAHLEQLEEMEALCCKEGTLLCQQPDMVRMNQSHICIWRVCAQTGGYHGEKGPLCPEHDSSAAAIP